MSKIKISKAIHNGVAVRRDVSGAVVDLSKIKIFESNSQQDAQA